MSAARFIVEPPPRESATFRSGRLNWQIHLHVAVVAMRVAALSVPSARPAPPHPRETA